MGNVKQTHRFQCEICEKDGIFRICSKSRGLIGDFYVILTYPGN